MLGAEFFTRLLGMVVLGLISVYGVKLGFSAFKTKDYLWTIGLFALSTFCLVIAYLLLRSLIIVLP